MKKIIVVLTAASVAVLFACHKKAVPAVSDRTEQPPPPAEKSITYAADDALAGKTVYDTKCGRCHGLKPTTDYTTDKWEGILKSMIPKARLDETQSRQVTAYVMMNAKK